MATKTFEELKQMAIQIRDEKANKQNTATRIGTQMVEHLNKLEQEYYDKTNIDEQFKEVDTQFEELNSDRIKKTTEINISNLYPTNGVGGTNKYTLAGAIAQVPAEYRTVVGLKITFISNDTSKPETWKYNGGTFTTTTNWKQGDGSGGNLILAWKTDVATTRKQVLQQERKSLLQISYENEYGDVINEQYIGTSFADVEWAKDSNWEKVAMNSDISVLKDILKIDDKYEDVTDEFTVSNGTQVYGNVGESIKFSSNDLNNVYIDKSKYDSLISQNPIRVQIDTNTNLNVSYYVVYVDRDNIITRKDIAGGSYKNMIFDYTIRFSEGEAGVFIHSIVTPLVKQFQDGVYINRLDKIELDIAGLISSNQVSDTLIFGGTVKNNIFDKTALEGYIYEYDKAIKAESSLLGQNINDIQLSAASNHVIYKIPVNGANYISYLAFKTTIQSGCLATDKNGIIVWIKYFTEIPSDGVVIEKLPENADYFYYTRSESQQEKDYFVYSAIVPQDGGIVEDFSQKISTIPLLLNGTKDYFSTIYPFNNTIYKPSGFIGEHINEVPFITNNGYTTLIIDLLNVDIIEYPMFKTTEGNGCLIIDDSGIVVWEHVNTSDDSGTLNTVVVQDNYKIMYLTISPSIANSVISISNKYYKSIEDNILSKQASLFSKARVNWLPFYSTWNNEDKNSLCLCSIQFDFKDNKFPFQRGYLFHLLPNDNKKLFYGTRLDNAKEIATLDYYPKNCLMAISPKGAIIGATRGNRGDLHVYHNDDNHTVSPLSSDGLNKLPMGWLYNSGVEFVTDAEGNEICLFAEYDGSASDKGGFYVWKGIYPYTDASNWKTVFHQDFQYYGEIQPDTITHFHMVRKDPWSGILYLTSGDQPKQLKWWYSTDDGDTWTLLTDNSTNGWEEHQCRLINFIFTPDYIYWSNDHGINHALNRISRNPDNGLIDISTREKVTDLPFAQATNSLCYVESPNGLFLFERIDTGGSFTPYYGGKVKVLFWSFDYEKLFAVASLKLTNNSWGGHRGKCYFNYTNGQEPRPAMGFSDDTRCVFDLIGADSLNIGTIYYDL